MAAITLDVAEQPTVELDVAASDAVTVTGVPSDAPGSTYPAVRVSLGVMVAVWPLTLFVADAVTEPSEMALPSFSA